MTRYRALFFNAEGLATHSHALECENDDDAIEHAARVRHHHALEIWDQDRLVWRFEPRGAAGALRIGERAWPELESRRGTKASPAD